MRRRWMSSLPFATYRPARNAPSFCAEPTHRGLCTVGCLVASTRYRPILDEADLTHSASVCAALLVPIPFTLAKLVMLNAPGLTAILGPELVIFGGAFAVSSLLHSYLIPAFAGQTRVTMDVVFYHMRNAAGLLLGTAPSKLSF